MGGGGGDDASLAPKKKTTKAKASSSAAKKLKRKDVRQGHIVHSCLVCYCSVSVFLTPNNSSGIPSLSTANNV